MPDISHKVLEQIGQQHVAPKPKWQFLLNRGVIVFLLGLSVVLGSLACAVVLFYIYDFDWDVYSRLSDSGWALILLDMPYIWIGFSILFIISAYYHFKHTKHGYRFGLGLTVLVTLILSFAGGVVVYSFTDLPETLDDLAVKNVPFYERLMVTKENRWFRPEIGLLAGMVEELHEEELLLHDVRDHLWTIDLTRVHPPLMHLEEGVRIRIEGHQIGPDHFQAVIIRPWFVRPPRPRPLLPFPRPLLPLREKVKENILNNRMNQ